MDLGNGEEIDFNKLSPEKLHEARAEVNAAGEAQGLWVPEGAGSLVVAETVENHPPEELRNQILANAETEIEHTNRVFEIINTTRRKKDHLPITPAGEHRERLEDQLSDYALKAAGQLCMINNYRPLIPSPPLPGPITDEELVTAIYEFSEHGTHRWIGRPPLNLSLLKNFPIDALSGYDPERAESGALSLVETDYDGSREGDRDWQLEKLRKVQEEFPEIGAAPILATASLSQRYDGQPNSWRDTITRAIEVDPVEVYDDRNDYYVLSADGGDNYTHPHVGDSSVSTDWTVSRWQLKLNT